MDSTWTPDIPEKLHMNSRKTPEKLHINYILSQMDSNWSLYGVYVDSRETPQKLHGVYMESPWKLKYEGFNTKCHVNIVYIMYL